MKSKLSRSEAETLLMDAVKDIVGRAVEEGKVEAFIAERIEERGDGVEADYFVTIEDDIEEIVDMISDCIAD